MKKHIGTLIIRRVGGSNFNAARSFNSLANFPLCGGRIVRGSISAAIVDHGNFMAIYTQYTICISHRSDKLCVGLVDASDMMNLLQKKCDTELVGVVVFIFLINEKEV